MERKTLEQFRDEVSLSEYDFTTFKKLLSHCNEESYAEIIVRHKALELFHAQEVKALKEENASLKWVYISDRFPICYETGDWDGKRSDFVVVETEKGLYEVARLYSGISDGSVFNVWATADDYEVELVIKWKSLLQ